MLGLVIAFIFIFIVGLGLWWKQRFQYWEKRGVPHLKPESFFYGNIPNMFTGKISITESARKLYDDLAPHKFGGFYYYSLPALYIRDPELIKTVLIRDFQHFHDHTSEVMIDPLLSHLFFLSGREWEILRKKLTPTFTAVKIKLLFDLMAECTDKLEKIVEKCVSKQETVIVQELMARYGTDVISSCAFGLEADSMHDQNSEFRARGREIFTPSLQARLYIFLLNTCPKLIRWFRIRRIPRHLNDFFHNLVYDTIKYRKENGIVRSDFLDLLMKLQDEQKGDKLKLDLNPPAQCFLFFFAGFDTSANTLTFLLYELAQNQDVQKKLQAEIDRVLASHDGKVNYDSLNEMTYMEKVFNESARLHTIIPYLERLCTAEYRIPGTNVIVEKGLTVRIPTYGMHKDPQYYPDPEKFNPENFSEEAKSARPPCTFMPFGDGPRNCIGMRFGVMQVKLALTRLLKKYTVTIAPEMILPLELKLHTRTTTPKNDVLLIFTKRTE